MLTTTILLALLAVCSGIDLQIQNTGNADLWIGTLGNPGKPVLKNGGFDLPAGQKVTLQAPDDWAGRIWARTGCNAASKHCDTGDCGNKLECNGAGGAPPATLVEVTLKDDKGRQWYDVSVVDGFNVKASITPVGGTGDNCKKSDCSSDNLNSQCPDQQKLKNGQGTVVACKSACTAYRTDEACCTGEYQNSQKCGATPGSKFFKSHCPNAYSFAYDDPSSLKSCDKAQSYAITFG